MEKLQHLGVLAKLALSGVFGLGFSCLAMPDDCGRIHHFVIAGLHGHHAPHVAWDLAITRRSLAVEPSLEPLSLPALPSPSPSEVTDR